MARGVMDTLRTTSGATLNRCLWSASAESVDKLVTSLKLHHNFGSIKSETFVDLVL